MAKLSPEDRSWPRPRCFVPSTRTAGSGSMGPIQKVMVKGQPVFLCCKGCEAEAKAHPDDTLFKVQNLMSPAGEAAATVIVVRSSLNTTRTKPRRCTAWGVS